MIELTRKNIRAVRTMIRKSLGVTARRAPWITLLATDNQLQIQAVGKTVAFEIRFPGHYQPECFAIPYEALTACEGRQDDPVSFAKRDDTMTVEWSDKGIPQSASFPVSEPAEMPGHPETLTNIEPRFLAAMANAVATTERNRRIDLLWTVFGCEAVTGRSPPPTAVRHWLRLATRFRGRTSCWCSRPLHSLRVLFQEPMRC